ncbi:MAG: RNA polymerase sigma-70 factor [Odoribacter sp.]|nr:RNA polymerase sigma-70 factor [Odoribacter sp.]
MPKINISPDIIIKIKSGDHKAFEKVFNIFYPRVKNFIKAITKKDDLAEELAQQVFVDLWINKEKLDSEKNMSAYIYTMARNSAITTLKQESRFEHNEESYYDKTDSSMTDDRLIAKETELLIRLAIAHMPPKRKEVYEMSRFQNKSNEEISTELHISRKVVEKHLRLALKELRKAIEIFLLFFLI